MSASSDLELARTGDRDAMRRIVIDEQRVVRAYLARLVPDADTADDLAQDVFIAAFQDLERVDPQRGLRGYLLGIARNLAFQAWRTGARRREVGGDAVFTAIAARIEAEPEEDDRLPALRRCLERLAPRAADVVARYYRDGRSCEEIGTAMGLAIGSVRSILTRSRSALQQCLGDGRGVRT